MNIVKNPLAQILGVALQNIRNKNRLSSDLVANELGVSPSAYRMIEAGSANINPNKVLALIRITCFDEIQFEKLSKLIVAIHVIEPILNNLSNLVEAISYDDELFSLFTSNEASTHSLLSNTSLFKAYLTEAETNNKIQAYLFRNSKLNFNKLYDELNLIEQNTPSIFNDLVESGIKQIRLELKNFENIADIEKRIIDLKEKVKELNGFQLRFNYDNSLAWRHDKKFIATSGVFFDFSNLINLTILEKYKDNFLQLWKPHFNDLNYLIISADKKQVATVIKKFRELLKTVIYKEIKDEPNTIAFEEGLTKFNYCVVSPNEPLLKNLGIEGEFKELWIYQIGENRNYAFLNRRTKREKDLPEEAFGYQFLSNQKVKEYTNSFKHIWQIQKLNSQT